MNALRNSRGHMPRGRQQLSETGDIQDRSDGCLRRVAELEANLEVAAFEFEIANIVFFQELNQFL